MGCDHPVLGELGRACRVDLYLLTGDEIPFVQDGLRDGQSIRHEMHGWFEEALPNTGVPWLTVRGTRSERLAAAVKAVVVRADGPFRTPFGQGPSKG